MIFPERGAIARHLVAILLLAADWYFLREWYLFQGPIDRALFFIIYATFLVLVLWPYFKSLESISPLRLIVCGLLILLIFPWGEWIRLSTSTSREEWSLQVYSQTTFLYCSFLLMRLFPQLVPRIHRGFSRFLEIFSAKHSYLWIIPSLFLFFTVWIAFFVYRQTPIVQDSAAHLFQAKIFSAGKIFAPAPPVPEFFSITGDMLVMQDGRWFGMYQPGFALILALGMLIKAEWLISPILGAATITIWIAYVRRWHNPLAAPLFGLLALLSPFLFMMSSTIMVFTPELFTATCIIYFCRLQTEEERNWRYGLIFLLLVYGTNVRTFSLLPFVAPVLAYTAWNRFRARSYWCPISIVTGVIAGIGVLMWYQQQTTGNPFLPAYLLEYPDVGYGFGKHFAGEHTPVKSLENISNNLLGMNDWLNGWLSGSIFFVILFFILEKKIQKWDILLLLGCGSLAFFYFFFFFQDLFFGPRYYYCLAPVFLLMVTRSIMPDESAIPQLQPYLSTLVLICFVSFVPFKLSEYLYRYSLETNGGYLRNEIIRNGEQKRLVFLDKNLQNYFVSWNNPFLKKPVIIVRDFGERNPEAIKTFPDYKPAYYRMEIQYKKKKLDAEFRFYDSPRNRPPGYISFFELAMTIQAANDYWTRDCFDTTYTDLFNAEESQFILEYLTQEEMKLPADKKYTHHFRQALIHSGRMLLLPKLASEKQGLEWANAFDYDGFQKEFSAAIGSFVASGETGKSMLRQLEKVQKRIDQNRDGNLSDTELNYFLNQKIRIFIMGG